MKTVCSLCHKLLCPATLLVAVFQAMPLQAAEPAKTDKPATESAAAASLDGTWRPVSAVLNGTTLPAVAVQAITLTLEGENYEVTVKGEPRSDKGTAKVDTTTTPARMTISGADGPNNGKTFFAIYETGKKDNGAGFLRVCYDLNGKAFPEKFESAAGSEHYLVEYRRVEPKKVTSAAEDAKTQNGIWKPAGAMLGGAKVPTAELKKITLTVKDGNYEVVIGDESNSDKGTVTLDDSVTPKRMTIVSTEGANKGKTFPAIYQMGENNGTDTMRICYDLSGKDFPKDFTSPKGSMQYLVGYRRQPAAKDQKEKPAEKP